MDITVADVRAAREGIDKTAEVNFWGNKESRTAATQYDETLAQYADQGYWQSKFQQELQGLEGEDLVKAKAAAAQKYSKQVVDTYGQYKESAEAGREGGIFDPKSSITGGLGAAIGALLGGLFGGKGGAAIGGLLGGVALYAMQKLDLTPDFAKSFVDTAASKVFGMADTSMDEATMKETIDAAGTKVMEGIQQQNAVPPAETPAAPDTPPATMPAEDPTKLSTQIKQQQGKPYDELLQEFKSPAGQAEKRKLMESMQEYLHPTAVGQIHPDLKQAAQRDPSAYAAARKKQMLAQDDAAADVHLAADSGKLPILQKGPMSEEQAATNRLERAYDITTGNDPNRSVPFASAMSPVPAKYPTEKMEAGTVTQPKPQEPADFKPEMPKKTP